MVSPKLILAFGFTAVFGTIGYGDVAQGQERMPPALFQIQAQAAPEGSPLTRKELLSALLDQNTALWFAVLDPLNIEMERRHEAFADWVLTSDSPRARCILPVLTKLVRWKNQERTLDIASEVASFSDYPQIHLNFTIPHGGAGGETGIYYLWLHAGFTEPNKNFVENLSEGTSTSDEFITGVRHCPVVHNLDQSLARLLSRVRQESLRRRRPVRVHIGDPMDGGTHSAR